MIETFITSPTQNNDSTGSVFMAIGTMFLSLFIGGILAWAYYSSDKNQYLFITILSVFIFIYGVLNMTYALLNKDAIDITSYNIIFGSSIYIIFMIFFIIVIFSIKTFGKQTVPDVENRVY